MIRLERLLHRRVPSEKIRQLSVSVSLLSLELCIQNLVRMSPLWSVWLGHCCGHLLAVLPHYTVSSLRSSGVTACYRYSGPLDTLSIPASQQPRLWLCPGESRKRNLARFYCCKHGITAVNREEKKTHFFLIKKVKSNLVENLRKIEKVKFGHTLKEDH